MAAKKKPAETTEPKDMPVSAGMKFGLPLDSFEVVEETIERNEFLSDILSAYNIDNATVLRLAEKAKDVFSVRNLAAGNPYTVFCSKDSSHTARYFIYQPNPVDYVVYDLRDTLNVYKGKRKVTVKTQTLSGVINSSLYETLEKEGADAALAVKLAHIFAWTIDFYGIQKGDWFKILYEQRYIKGEPVEAGSIQSAVFSHKGEQYTAYYFQPDSTREGEYFNEEGKSLRKAFLKAPLKFSRISSRFTLKRFHPVQKRWKAHLGTDYAAPTGTPIIATANGTVIESRYTRFNGNYVKLKHNGTYTTQYLHMSKRAVKVGQHISQGQVIGYVGSTGLATGPHVCYRFWKNGRQVDPLREKFPSAIPVSGENLAAFNQVVDSANKVLKGINIQISENQAK
ncbi:MAG: peptidoglycan DD-metalloendopeptidase family protein [Terrimonas sp.]|nr:peptidoglycan DD-metalloendopeptidase family protein [Terrimonas sp.]